MTTPLDSATPLDALATSASVAATGFADQTAHFGHGGAQPYETALTHGRPLLRLRPVAEGHARLLPQVEDHPIEVARFLAAPDAADRSVVRHTAGPVLDIGCGPGRMVAEAMRQGRISLGIDVSPAAVALARDAGRPALLRSVFEPLPGEGSWGTALLLDGNIGIGGDPVALLARCGDVTAPGGTVVVEAHPDATRHARFHAQLVDDDGVASAAFPWAQTGSQTVAGLAVEVGLEPLRLLTRGGRRFVILRRPAGAS